MSRSFRTICFRTDASLPLGTGHVARCLCLAEALRKRGLFCAFICEDVPGNQLQKIRDLGYPAHPLYLESTSRARDAMISHAPAGTWLQDAEATMQVMENYPGACIVVDSYALDAKWEAAIRPSATHLIVIDDLADRSHKCDMLLDQNLGRKAAHYAGLVPENCAILAGPSYALLREEFRNARTCSLKRRTSGNLKRLLISMGGLDASNATGQVLEWLERCKLPEVMQIDILMGSAAPWLEHVRKLSASMSSRARLFVDADNVAELMAGSDLAIGAVGGSAWERCCLGLPSLLVIVADNQVFGARALVEEGAAMLLGDIRESVDTLRQAPSTMIEVEQLVQMSSRAAALVDGLGVDRVCEQMCGLHD